MNFRLLAVLLILGTAGMLTFVAYRKGEERDLEALCQEFARLKNADDPGANALLAPGPDLTQEVVDEDAKEAFDAASVLHNPCEIIDVWADSSTSSSHRFVLVIRGGAATPKVSVRTAAGLQSPGQRILINPDVLVEVRAGRIHPITVGLHRDRP
jgi:hypothetical protein